MKIGRRVGKGGGRRVGGTRRGRSRREEVIEG
jgi:hypothetical protein